MNERFGPYYPFACSAFAILVFLSFARLGITFLNAEHVRDASDLLSILVQGVRVDLASIARLYVLALILFVVSRKLPRPIRFVVDWTCIVYLTAIATAFVFFEAITPTYIDEYGTRPERKFFEYLNSPAETFGMLWLSFRLQVVVSLTAFFGALLCFFRWHKKWIEAAGDWGYARTFLSLPIVVFCLFVAGRSTFEGKPLHPGQVAFANDILLNNLPLNSLFSAAYAAYRMLEEGDPGAVYGAMPEDEIRRIVTAATQPRYGVSAAVEVPSSPKNIVVILEESLGARYVKSLGGADLTPRLAELSGEGWWFERMYATGTRSVRGIEAVLAGFLPTPGRSVVRLADSQTHFFTLAALLGKAGYESGFYYGGRSDFDNMRGFTLSNGFDYVYDEDSVINGRFRSTYGYCDDDIFDAMHERLSHEPARPKFIVTLTTSNHQPFEFPADAGADYTEPLYSRENAVRYADAALGRFIDRARQAPYWDNTIFLIVADHDAKVAGSWSADNLERTAKKFGPFPVEGFRIPALILGGSVPVQRSSYLVSQIDLPTTLLGLAGITGPHPMLGVDLGQIDTRYRGRAIMQFADHHAHLVDDRMVILRPQQPPLVGRYRDGGFVETGEEGSGGLVRQALAFALWPSLVYLRDEYRMGGARTSPSGHR